MPNFTSFGLLSRHSFMGVIGVLEYELLLMSDVFAFIVRSR